MLIRAAPLETGGEIKTTHNDQRRVSRAISQNKVKSRRFSSRASGCCNSRIFSASSSAGPPGTLYGAAISFSSVSFSRDLPVTPCCCSAVTVRWMNSSSASRFQPAVNQHSLCPTGHLGLLEALHLLAALGEPVQLPPTTEPGACEPPGLCTTVDSELTIPTLIPVFDRWIP